MDLFINFNLNIMVSKSVKLTYTFKSEFLAKVRELSTSINFRCVSFSHNCYKYRVVDPDLDIDFLFIEYSDIVSLHFTY